MLLLKILWLCTKLCRTTNNHRLIFAVGSELDSPFAPGGIESSTDQSHELNGNPRDAFLPRPRPDQGALTSQAMAVSFRRAARENLLLCFVEKPALSLLTMKMQAFFCEKRTGSFLKKETLFSFSQNNFKQVVLKLEISSKWDPGKCFGPKRSSGRRNDLCVTGTRTNWTHPESREMDLEQMSYQEDLFYLTAVVVNICTISTLSLQIWRLKV